MPASSKAQRRFMGMVTALKKGTLKMKNLPKSVADKVKKAADSMTAKAAHDFAKTKEKGLPVHVKEDDLCLDLMTFKDFLIFESILAQELTEDDMLLIEQVVEEGTKPSAGLTKKEKSTLVKRAKRGEDVGNKGKKFKDVAEKAAKKYGGKQAGERVAAAAMWKARAKRK